MQQEQLPGRIPPHNLEAERSVIGALLLDAGRIPDVAEFLLPEDYYDVRNRLVYEALLDLAERSLPIDFLTLGDALLATGKSQKVGGQSYLVEVASCVTSAAHLKHHARIVSETSVLRRLIAESTHIIGSAYQTPADGESVQLLLDQSEDAIMKIGEERDSSGAEPISKAIEETFQRIDSASHRRGISGLASGFYDLDEMLCGFNPGDFIVLAARPSMGKSALILNVIENALFHPPEWMDRSVSILLFSLEMGRQSIASRMLCARADVDGHKLRTGKIPAEDYAQLAEAAGELRAMNLFIDDTPGLTVMSMRSRARRIKRQHELDMVVVDYLQLMSHPKSESRQMEISSISRSLKELARELNIPVVALSQLSRAVESREDKRPMLSDLRESGSIEQDADVVLLLFRPEYYNPTDENRGQAELICAKQRNGPTGKVKLHFSGGTMRFKNPALSIAEPIVP